jgi:hypothetical protein
MIIASNCFMVPKDVKILPNVSSRNDFIMQNYFVRNRETIFAVHQNYKKKLKIGNNFWSKYLQIYVITCDTMFFADKNKVNSIH